MMNKRSQQLRTAYDDVFFSFILIMIGSYSAYSDWPYWKGEAVVMIMFGLLLLGIRIYHLTHRDKVFGKNDETA